MCGIAGYLGYQKRTNGQISACLSSMHNRGPNAKGSLYISVNAQTHLHLLHTRLSILDLDQRSNQPFEKEHVALVFNGEIYNYIEIRLALEAKGHVFSTQSDTEVLLHAYLEYGKGCVDHFEGMWSFALYDKKEKTLFLSKDRFNEKPLFYFKTSDGLFFGSQTTFLEHLAGRKMEINRAQIFRFLVNGHKSLYKQNQSFFSQVQDLPFATNLLVNPDLSLVFKRYWAPFYKPEITDTQTAIKGIRERLIQSVKLRMRSDVPLSFCLSGGVDSASLASIAAKEFNHHVHTFSIIDSDKRYNESENINATLQDIQCENHSIYLHPQENHLENLKGLVAYHNAPVLTISYYVHSLLLKAISDKGFKISISGTAADEIFTGYYDHFNLHLYEMKDHPEFSSYLQDWRTYPAQYVRHPSFKNPRLYFDDPSKRAHIYLNSAVFSSFLKTDFKEPFTETTYVSSLLRNRMNNELFNEVVPVILHEDDLNAMCYSVENRSPFLDTNLIEYMYRISSDLLIQKGYAKYLLREAMQGILNDKVRLSREKKGFNASINSIVDFESKQDIDFLLSDGPIFDFVEREKIEKLLTERQFENSYKKFIFNFLSTKLFLEHHEQAL